jgi:hypothetical protein
VELQPAARRGRPGAATVWLVWTVGLTLFFAAMAARDLGNFRPVSSDEGEIMAVSYKLATEGVLGSDPQAGFFHAEAHHFLTLPVQHVLQALSFEVFGVGVAQARGVALAGALSLIWVLGWLAWRWYGLRAAVLGELLLVGWASNLVPGFPGLPLLTVARTARYDVTAVAFLWVSLGLLEATLRRPTRLGALATGVSAGLAALTQFFGVFALPLVALAWLGQAGRRAWAHPTAYWMLVGAGLPLLAYAMYTLHSFADLVGQSALARRHPLGASQSGMPEPWTWWRWSPAIACWARPSPCSPGPADRSVFAPGSRGCATTGLAAAWASRGAPSSRWAGPGA